MSLNRNRLYAFLIISCTAGYSWLYINHISSISRNHLFGVCLIKKLTAVPCPSCGTTRSILFLLEGRFSEALHLNPLGFLLLAVMVISPFWIVYDLISGRNGLFSMYKKMEFELGRRIIAVPAILLVLMNWLWNIHKGL